MSFSDFIKGLVVGRPAPKATIVPNSSGTITTITRQWSGSTLALNSAFTTHANLSLNTSTGEVSATTALGAGVTQNLYYTETKADGSVYGACVAISALTPTSGHVLTYQMLDDFETLTNRSSSGGTFALTTTGEIHGTNAMLLTGTGSNALMNSTAFNTDDPSSWDLIALYADFGNDLYNADSASLLPSFTIGGTAYQYSFDPLTTQPYQAITPNTKGKQWFAFAANRFRAAGSWTGTKMTDLTGTQSKMSRIGNGPAGSTCGMGKLTVDAMVLVERHKPSVILSFDDCNSLQYSQGFPMLAARGFKGTIYVAPDNIGSGHLTLANLQEMHAAGWAMAIDSSPADEPFHFWPTVAQGVTKIQTIRDWVSTNVGSEAIDHMCYSWTPPWYPIGLQSYSFTADGSNVVTNSGGTVPFTFCFPGMYVYGSGVPANTYIVQVLSATTVQLSNPVPAGTVTLNFLGRLRGQAVTCNGTTAVTLTSTASLVAGMAVSGGANVPADTRIQSVDSATQITVTNAIPASVVKLNFDLDNGEFWGAKAEDALIAAGFKSGRLTSGGGVYTGFGIDPNFAMHFPGFNWETNSTSTANTVIAKIQQQIDAANDQNLFQHMGATPSDSFASMITILDYLKARQDAGECEVVTVSEWWAKVQARGAFA